MQKLVILIGMLFLFIISPLPALAQGPRSDGVTVQLGSNLTLEEDDSVEGGVIILGGNLTMLPGSEVEGDVVVFGGNAVIQGEVYGDVASIGGNVEVMSEATIHGDVTSAGGTVQVAEGAEVEGDIVNGVEGLKGSVPPIAPEPAATPESVVPAVPPVAPVPTVPRERPIERPSRPFDASRSTVLTRVGQFFGDGFEDIFVALIVSGLSVLLILFFPRHAQTIQSTLSEATGVSFVVGIVTLPVVATVLGLLALLSILIVPICGFIIVAVGLAVALLAGWSVIGKFIGNQVFTRFDYPRPSEISATFLGAAILTLVTTMPFVDHLPIIGWMFWLIGFLVATLVGSTGLGAVILSRFGTQTYQPAVSGMLAAIDRNMPVTSSGSLDQGPTLPSDREDETERM